MAKTKPNPVRGQYLLVGTDLIRAGIKDGVVIREDNGTAIYLVDPATERWMTSRAVSSASAKIGKAIDAASVPVVEIKAALLQDRKAIVRTTEDHIVHMLGGDTPENRTYAKAQVALLEETYATKAA